MEIFNLPLIHLKKGMDNKLFSQEEVYKSFSDRIVQLDGELNAFLTLCEVPYARDNANGNALKGIPVALKDVFVTEGLRTTAGSQVLEKYIPEYSGTIVHRLLEQGANIIGKTNLDAWAHGSSGENSDFGSSKNPWNTQYSPGGSSSGSAVAVAAGMSPVTFGTDTGGSIRLPASFCNVVGLKPTYGAFSRYGVISMSSSLDCPGIFTKTVEDCEYVFDHIVGKDQYDGTSLDYKSEKVPDKIRIGIPVEYFDKGLNPEVKYVVETAIKQLQSSPMVSEVVEVSLPHTEYGIAVYYLIQTSEVSSNLARYDGIRYGNGRDAFGDEAKRRIMLGTFALSSGYADKYYKKALQVRTLILKDYKDAFSKVDVLIAPVSPTPAFKLGEKTEDPLAMYLSDILTVTANLAGIPSIAIPAGFSKTGLPIGMQIMGSHQGESLLFSLGKEFQKITNWHIRQPAL